MPSFPASVVEHHAARLEEIGHGERGFAANCG
jgi:hypothetical protein